MDLPTASPFCGACASAVCVFEDGDAEAAARILKSPGVHDPSEQTTADMKAKFQTTWAANSLLALD